MAEHGKSSILGKKLGMTQIFTEEGKVVPVTVVEAGQCVVVGNKTVENDGYNAVQTWFWSRERYKRHQADEGSFCKSWRDPRKIHPGNPPGGRFRIHCRTGHWC